MAVETQAVANGRGIALTPMTVELPTAVIGTIHIQGTIHKLLVEAFVEQSKTKLLQAILLEIYDGADILPSVRDDRQCASCRKTFCPPLEWK